MSADEIDAELLAMAGDSSDDEDASEGELQHTPHLHDPRSPSEGVVQPSVEKVAVEEAASGERRRGVAQKVRRRGKKKVTRREIEDELDDLGDASSSPPASLGSGAMSESSPEPDVAISPNTDDDRLYPLEGRFTSARDRDDILALPEIERESILAERAQEVLKRQQDLQLRKALAAAQAANKHKRKAAAADLDDGGVRKSSRAKTEKVGRSALDDYKKAREAKGAERTSRIDGPRHSRRDERRSQSSASDRDADGESEVEWADQPASADHRLRDHRDEQPPDLKDFERCRVGRSNFAKVCFYPNFEATMKGCFCRVSIGVNRETGMNTYRMTQIKGFTEGRSYQLEGSNGKNFTTDQYALVAQGSAEKPWPFSACSDSRFSESEFLRYRETLEKERVRAPKKAWLVQKLGDIHNFLNIDWTDEVLQQKFAKQRAMERKLDPANAMKMKRERIAKKKAEAEESGDVEEVTRCEAELVALDNQANSANGAHRTNTALTAKASPMKSSAAQQERLALINQKNRGKNADDVRRALLEERRKLQREREKALVQAKKAEAEMRLEEERKRVEKEQAQLLGVPMDDLFGSTPDISRAGTPMSGTSTPRPRMRSRSRAGTPAGGVGGGGGGGKKGLGLGAGLLKKKVRKEDEGDALAGLDLGIDIEI